MAQFKNFISPYLTKIQELNFHVLKQMILAVILGIESESFGSDLHIVDPVGEIDHNFKVIFR